MADIKDTILVAPEPMLDGGIQIEDIVREVPVYQVWRIRWRSRIGMEATKSQVSSEAVNGHLGFAKKQFCSRKNRPRIRFPVGKIGMLR